MENPQRYGRKGAYTGVLYLFISKFRAGRAELTLSRDKNPCDSVVGG